MSSPAAAHPGFGRRLAAAAGLLVCLLLALLLTCNLALILQGALDPDEPPGVLGITPLVVLSGSMSSDRPGHVEVGDLVLVRHTDPETLAEGDVITYRSGQGTVTHRITAIKTGEGGALRFTTQGDANNTPDTDPVTADQVVGRVWLRIPRLGDLLLFLQRPAGILLAAGIPLGALALYTLVQRRRQDRAAQHRVKELEAELTRLRTPAPGNIPQPAPGDPPRPAARPRRIRRSAAAPQPQEANGNANK